MSLERLGRLEDPLPNEEEVIKNVAGTAYAAGAGTVCDSSLEDLTGSNQDLSDRVFPHFFTQL